LRDRKGWGVSGNLREALKRGPQLLQKRLRTGSLMLLLYIASPTSVPKQIGEKINQEKGGVMGAFFIQSKSTVGKFRKRLLIINSHNVGKSVPGQ